MEVILSKTNDDKSYKVQNKNIFPMFVGWNFRPYRAYMADIVTALLINQYWNGVETVIFGTI